MTRYAPQIDSPIHAIVAVPGSKSITNRALLLAALATGTTVLRNALFCDDTERMVECLQRLGIDLLADPEQETIHVVGNAGPFQTGNVELFVGNSGTTARFITPAIVAGTGTITLDGVSRMRERPMQDLIDAITPLGGNVTSINGTGCPPLRIVASGLHGGTTQIRADASSQFLSGLLLASPYFKTPTTIRIDGPLLSAPYVAMTIAMMRSFGIMPEVSSDMRTFYIPNHTGYTSPVTYEIEPDASSASYFFAAAAVTGGRVTVRGLTRNDSLQGDVEFTGILEQMGCKVFDTENGLCVDASAGPLVGITADMNAISDTLMTAAVVAPFAQQGCTFTNVAHVRHKETDRLNATAAELHRFGVTVHASQDALMINPVPPGGLPKPANTCEWHTYDDHRMAMCAAVFGLRVPGVQIAGAECVSKTFPDFFDRWEMMLACSKD